MATCPCQLRRAALLAAQAPTNSAPEETHAMPEFSAEEWAKAAGVVVSAMILGAILGSLVEHPVVGLGLGALAGAAINWQTECPVCRAHAASLMGGAS